MNDMEEMLLLTVEHAVQAGDDLLIAPFLPADNYEFDLDWINKVKIVKPDNQVVEKDAEFTIPLDASSRIYILLIPNTQEDEVPIGSQIWIK
jgi:hypothetical protein